MNIRGLLALSVLLAMVCACASSNNTVIKKIILLWIIKILPRASTKKLIPMRKHNKVVISFVVSEYFENVLPATVWITPASIRSVQTFIQFWGVKLAQFLASAIPRQCRIQTLYGMLQLWMNFSSARQLYYQATPWHLPGLEKLKIATR